MGKKYDIYITFPSQQIGDDVKMFQSANALAGKLKLAISRILKRKVNLIWKGDHNLNQTEYRQVIHEAKSAKTP